DTARGVEICCLRGHKSYVFSVAYAPDGRRGASGSEDRTVSVWGAVRGRKLIQLRGPEGEGARVGFARTAGAPPVGRMTVQCAFGIPFGAPVFAACGTRAWW